MPLDRVLVIGGECDGQIAYVYTEIDRHAVHKRPVERFPCPAAKDLAVNRPEETRHIYHLHRLCVYSGRSRVIAYFLCDVPSVDDLCSWAKDMINKRVLKFEAEKKEGLYE